MNENELVWDLGKSMAHYLDCAILNPEETRKKEREAKKERKAIKARKKERARLEAIVVKIALAERRAILGSLYMNGPEDRRFFRMASGKECEFDSACDALIAFLE